MNKDLTVGKPSTVLRSFCLPLFGSIIFQQLYNIADSLVAGKFIGENALAAVGNSYEITLIFIAFAFGCNIGCSVITSMYFGAKNYDRMKTAVSTSLIASALLCAALMAFGIGFCDDLLHLIRTPAEVFADSRLYLDIYVWGLPFVFFYNIATGIFSALGDSKTPFYFLAVSSVSNIAMDILFVAGFQMGVAGVAWATFICQGVSCVLAMVVVLLRLRGIPTEKKYAKFSWKICGDIAKIAIPSILQQSFISVGNIIIQGIINGFGPGVMAGYSASVKLNNLVITSFTTLGNGISNYSAQNLGAGKKERIPEGFKAGIRLVWTVTVPIFILYLTCGRVLLKFFMDKPSQAALGSGLMFLRIVTPFYFIAAVKLTADGVLRGTSMMGKFMIGTFTDLILRVVLAIILSKTVLGSTGIWCAWPIGWTVSAVLSLLFYRSGPWKVRKGQKEETEKAAQEIS
jgi:putative MATE family efflux protein